MDQRILIDALAARYGGNAYAAVALARELGRRPDVSAVLVVARRGSIVASGLASVPGVRCLALPEVGRLELVRRLGWEAFRLPALVRRERCTGVISMSGMLPRPVGERLACVLSNPVLYEVSTPGNLLRRWAIRRTARRATKLIAPSRLMAELVEDSVGRRCEVVPFGVDRSIFRPSAQAGERILCVADFYAHKRHDLVVAAWLGLPTPRPILHLVGNPAVDPVAHGRLLAEIASLPEAESIVVEHRIPLERLVRAYQRARVFIMPSDHESFCMPLAESLACGVPAVARGLSSLRETGGAGATYLDTDDPRQWTAAIRRLWQNDEHDRARRAAIEAAARFSWERFAAEVVHHLYSPAERRRASARSTA